MNHTQDSFQKCSAVFDQQTKLFTKHRRYGVEVANKMLAYMRAGDMSKSPQVMLVLGIDVDFEQMLNNLKPYV